MDEELKGYFERGIAALESLAEDPVIEVETHPPVCPHCEVVNPSVRIEETAASGKMAEIVMRYHCLHCNNIFYAIPLHWASVKTTQEAATVIQERAEYGGFNGTKS